MRRSERDATIVHLALRKSQSISRLAADVLKPIQALLVRQNCRSPHGRRPIGTGSIPEVGMAQDENKAFLKRVPLFSGLTDGQIERLAAGSVRRNFPKGRTIVAEGEPSQSLYVLLSGRAKVQRSDTEGKEVILSVLGPGECFGEMSLIDDAPRSASVITLESSDFMSIAKESFKAHPRLEPGDLPADHEGAWSSGCATPTRRSRRSRCSMSMAASPACCSTSPRRWAMIAWSRTSCPRQEIAKMIGASREMVSRVMKGLETEGYIVPMPEGRIMLREKLSNYLS